VEQSSKCRGGAAGAQVVANQRAGKRHQKKCGEDNKVEVSQRFLDPNPHEIIFYPILQ